MSNTCSCCCQISEELQQAADEIKYFAKNNYDAILQTVSNYLNSDVVEYTNADGEVESRNQYYLSDTGIQELVETYLLSTTLACWETDDQINIPQVAKTITKNILKYLYINGQTNWEKVYPGAPYKLLVTIGDILDFGTIDKAILEVEYLYFDSYEALFEGMDIIPQYLSDDLTPYGMRVLWLVNLDWVTLLKKSLLLALDGKVDNDQEVPLVEILKAALLYNCMRRALTEVIVDTATLQQSDQYRFYDRVYTLSKHLGQHNFELTFLRTQ